MSTQTLVRVFNPFRGRKVDATAAQARILRQVRRVMDCYISSAAERSRLQQHEWKAKSRRSILGDLEILDLAVTGAASWCAGSRKHPDPARTIKELRSLNLEELVKSLRKYPRLQAYLHEIEKLRALVVDYMTASRMGM